MTDSMVKGDFGRELRIHRPPHFRGQDGDENIVYLSIKDANGDNTFLNIIVPRDEFVEAVLEQFKDG